MGSICRTVFSALLASSPFQPFSIDDQYGITVEEINTEYLSLQTLYKQIVHLSSSHCVHPASTASNADDPEESEAYAVAVASLELIISMLS